jgi:ABC-type nitrate/sulfonate/bicarbonate transport system substrate-binding protein
VGLIFFLFALVFSLLTPMGTSACDDPPYHYKVPCKVVSSPVSPYVAIAEEMELFKRYKVQLEMIRVPGLNPEQVNRLLGDVHLLDLSGNVAVRAALEGSRFRIIATPVTYARFDVWTRTPIKTPGELKGRSIAVGEPGVGHSVALEAFLKSYGLDTKSIKRQVVPGAEQRAAAIRMGKFDTALFSPSWEPLLKDTGFVKAGMTEPIEFAREVFAVPETMLKNEKDMRFLANFLRSVMESMRFLRQTGNKLRAVQLIRKHSKMDESRAERIYLDYLPVSDEIRASTRGVRAVIDDLKPGLPAEAEKLDALSVEQLVTQDIVRLVR